MSRGLQFETVAAEVQTEVVTQLASDRDWLREALGALSATS
jgi:hypothetical protein